MLRGILFFFLLLSFGALKAQWSFSLGVFGGKVLKHKEEILFDVPAFSSALSLSAIYQTTGEKEWQRYWGNPRLEHHTLLLNFGNEPVLGKAIGLIPSYAFYIKRKENIEFLFHIGMGLGYLTRKYDINDNRTNNAIGSHLNNATRFRLSSSFKLKKNWKLEAGFNFIHFSNALAASPNTGINLYGPDLSLRYIFYQEKDENQDSLKQLTDFKRWKWNIQFGYAQKEISIPGGPNFPIYSISNGLVYHLSSFLKIYLGYEYEYNNARYFEEFYILEEEEPAEENASRHVIFTAIEGLLGRTGFRIQVGHYPEEQLFHSAEAIYFKLNLNVYANPMWKGRLKPYAGLLLKSHYAVAEYFAVVGGIEF